MSVSVSNETAAPGARPPAAGAVARVRHLQTRAWGDVLRGEGAEAAAKRDTAAARRDRPAPTAAVGPVWLELYLELDEVDADREQSIYNWFEGSIQPWDDLDRPAVAWDPEVADELSKLELEAPDPALANPPAATRALALLPHLYALGVNRVSQELSRKGIETGLKGPDADTNGSNGATGNGSGSKAHAPAPEGIELFPIVGFSPVSGDDEGLGVCTLRTNVAVIGNAMITIRLPDLPCPDSRRAPGQPPKRLEASDRATRKELYTPSRFFPCWDAGADDVAEEIARHQASTARALSDAVRDAVHTCARDGQDDATRPDRRSWREREKEEERKQQIFERLSQVTDMADRQIARLLRRLGGYGEDDGDSTDSQAGDIRRRYHFALDEIRSLERELGSARDRHRTHMDAQSQIDRSRFEDTVALAGAAILLPALIVGVFSANVWLPGHNATHRFVALLLLIVGCAGAAILVIDRIRARKLPETKAQWSIAAVVVVCFAGAIVQLATG
jgi:hypothetical protein